MNATPQVLLYNCKDRERLRTVQRYLKKSGVAVRLITAPEFLHPLGYLFEIPGFSPCPLFNMGRNFSEEMLVMKDFSEERLNQFLDFFRENHLEPIKLKAVLTPVTQYWSSLKLYDELLRERRVTERRAR